MEEDFQERFLKANANVDYMAQTLADVLRNCIRASVASNPSSQTYEAAKNFEMLLKLIVRSEGVRIYELLEKAIEDITVEPRPDSVDGAITHAAQMGMRFLVEQSCHDNAARGRAGKRRSEFLDAIKCIEEAREEMRRRYQLGK